MLNNLAKIEGLIYVTGDQGISKQELADVLSMNEEAVAKIVTKLKNNYDNNDDSAFQIVEYGDKYRLATKNELNKDIDILFSDNKDKLLTAAALETVTIIAYNQPVTRIEVDDIRGVNSSSIIQKLVKQDLIKTNGRKKVPGDPYLYVTTDNFLDLFGLKDLKELPPIEELKDEGEDIE